MAKILTEQWRINVAYGRRTQGEDCYNAKLTEDQVLKIVKLYNIDGYTLRGLGNMFRVSRSTIMKIVTGRSWSSITGIPQKDRKYKGISKTPQLD